MVWYSNSQKKLSLSDYVTSVITLSKMLKKYRSCSCTKPFNSVVQLNYVRLPNSNELNPWIEFDQVWLSLITECSIDYTCISLALFRCQTFHEPNLIHWIKYMKSLPSESLWNACFNLEWLCHSFCLARPGVLPLERLWYGFDSDAKLFMYRT